MVAINPVIFAVSKQAFYNERATKLCGSTTNVLGSNYQNSWKHLPENLVATTFLGSMPI